MLRKTIKYTDYNGMSREEGFDFHINKAELASLNLKYKGGLKEMLEFMARSEDGDGLVKFIKEIILMSYGVKEPGGKRFMKSEELRNAFEQSEAFSELFMSLLGDADATAEFVKGILPKDLNPDTVNAESPALNVIDGGAN